MKRTLATIVASLVLALSFAGAVAGGTVLTNSVQSCSEASLTLWEHTGGNGLGLTICKGFNVPDLGTYNLDNKTSKAIYDKGSWTGHACVYDLVNYNAANPLAWKEDFGPNDETVIYWFGGDKISSVKWVAC